MDGRSHLEDRNVPILTRLSSALVRLDMVYLFSFMFAQKKLGQKNIDADKIAPEDRQRIGDCNAEV